MRRGREDGREEGTENRKGRTGGRRGRRIGKGQEGGGDGGGYKEEEREEREEGREEGREIRKGGGDRKRGMEERPVGIWLQNVAYLLDDSSTLYLPKYHGCPSFSSRFI